MLHDLRRVVRIQVGEHDGHDLRVLQADDLRDRTRVHPLQGLQALGVAPEQDAVDEAAGLVLAQGLHEDLADVLVGADAERGLLVDRAHEVLQDLADLPLADGERGHGRTDLLDLLGPHVPQDGGGILLAERHQEDGGALGAVQLALGGVVAGGVIAHRCRSTSS